MVIDMSRKKSNNKAKQRMAKFQANQAKQQAYKAEQEELKLAPIRARLRMYQRYILRLELERGTRTHESLLCTLPCITAQDIEEIGKDDLCLETLREEYTKGSEEIPFQEWLAKQGH